eukprot:2898896-Prymnesium_polylepis.1
MRSVALQLRQCSLTWLAGIPLRGVLHVDGRPLVYFLHRERDDNLVRCRGRALCRRAVRDLCR